MYLVNNMPVVSKSIFILNSKINLEYRISKNYNGIDIHVKEQGLDWSEDSALWIPLEEANAVANAISELVNGY